MNWLGGGKSCSATDGAQRYRLQETYFEHAGLTPLRCVRVLMSLDLAVVTSPLCFRSPHPLYLPLLFRSLYLLLSCLVARPRPFAVRYLLVRRLVPGRAGITKIYSCVHFHVLVHKL